MSGNDQAVRDVVKGASVVYVGLVLELLIAFVAQVIAARYLSVSGFGGLTTGTTLLDIGSTVAALGLAAGLTRYLPRLDAAEKRSLVTTVLGITLATSIVLAAAVVVGAPYIASVIFGDPSVTVSIRIFGAAIPLATLLSVALGGIRGQKRSLYRVYVKNVGQPLARIVLVVLAVKLGLGQAGFAGAYALPYAVALALALVLLHRAIPRETLSIDVDLTRRVASYSLPLTLSGVAGFVYRSIDVFLVLHFLGSFAVGVYGVAYAAVSFMGMFSTAFNFLGSPVASELEHGGDADEVLRVFRSIARWLVVASVCALVPLGIFSTEFISVIYQSKYASGGVALTVLAIGFAVKNVLSIHGPIIQALGRSRVSAVNSVTAAGVNLVLNVALIPRMGITGAAVATALAFFVRDALAAIEVRYFLGDTPLRWNAFGPTLLAVPLLGGFALVVAPAIPTTVLWLLGVSGLFGLCYVSIVLVLFGLSPTEVMIVRSIEEKYGIDLGPLDPVVRFLADR